MESSGQKRGSSVVEASSSAPTPPKKRIWYKKDKRIKVSHQDADERLCNEFSKCIIDEELVKLSKDMF